MADLVVHIRINDVTTGKPTPVRLRFLDAMGTYLAPLGRDYHFPTGWNQRVGGNLCLTDWRVPSDRNASIDISRLKGHQRFAYVDGTCEVRLPNGAVFFEATKGVEFTPIQRQIERGPGQIALRFTISRQLDPQARGWYSADARAHFLTPQVACLEGAAEGLHCVNILAAEWPDAEGSRTYHTNLLEFSGQAAAWAKDECQCHVNTLNQDPERGSLALLNCHRIVFPLRLGKPGFEKWTFSDWCRQCHRKKGLVVWPEFASAAGERLAALVLGDIDAVEWSPASEFPTTGLAAWYQLLNAGCKVPLVGASGKTSNSEPLGAVRTYAHLSGSQGFDYAGWVNAVKGGRTFVTRGPLVYLSVGENLPGSSLMVEEPRTKLLVDAFAESIEPFDRLEIVEGGKVVAGTPCAEATTARVCFPLADTAPERTTWLAARCWSKNELIAHTSPLYLRGRQRRFDHTACVELERMLGEFSAASKRTARSEEQMNALVATGMAASEVLARRIRS